MKLHARKPDAPLMTLCGRIVLLAELRDDHEVTCGTCRAVIARRLIRQPCGCVPMKGGDPRWREHR